MLRYFVRLWGRLPTVALLRLVQQHAPHRKIVDRRSIRNTHAPLVGERPTLEPPRTGFLHPSAASLSDTRAAFRQRLRIDAIPLRLLSGRLAPVGTPLHWHIVRKSQPTLDAGLPRSRPQTLRAMRRGFRPMHQE